MGASTSQQLCEKSKSIDNAKSAHEWLQEDLKPMLTEQESRKHLRSAEILEVFSRISQYVNNEKSVFLYCWSLKIIMNDSPHSLPRQKGVDQNLPLSFSMIARALSNRLIIGNKAEALSEGLVTDRNIYVFQANVYLLELMETFATLSFTYFCDKEGGEHYATAVALLLPIIDLSIQPKWQQAVAAEIQKQQKHSTLKLIASLPPLLNQCLGLAMSKFSSFPEFFVSLRGNELVEQILLSRKEHDAQASKRVREILDAARRRRNWKVKGRICFLLELRACRRIKEAFLIFNVRFLVCRFIPATS